MIPDHYLHIILGLLIGLAGGAALGFAITSAIRDRRENRIQQDSWNCARIFYTRTSTGHN